MPAPRAVTAFADVVAASDAAAATSKRTAKVASLAGLLARLAPEEVQPAVGFLTGTPRQGRTGVGWATVAAVETAPAAEPSLTIDEVDAALTTVAASSGPGSTAVRNAVLHDLFARATEAEA